MYHTYWAWRMWEVARRSEDETFKFTSSLRGIFLLFSGFALFPRMHALAKAKGYDENAEPVLIAIFYLLAGVGSDVLSSILGQSEVVLSAFQASCYCRLSQCRINMRKLLRVNSHPVNRTGGWSSFSVSRSSSRLQCSIVEYSKTG